MAHEHTLTERFPRELFGRLQTAVIEEAAFVVHDVGIAINYCGMRVLCRRAGNGRQHIIGRKAVAGIHKHDIVTGGALQPLVHSVIKSAVGFRLQAHRPVGMHGRHLRLIGFHHLHGLIL